LRIRREGKEEERASSKALICASSPTTAFTILPLLPILLAMRLSSTVNGKILFIYIKINGEILRLAIKKKRKRKA
jgi:hypothetical protein